MSQDMDVELYTLEDGTKVAAGNLTLPAGEAPVLFAEYPESTLLGDNDIKKLLPENHYKQERARFRKWIINQSTASKCTTSACVGGFYQIEANDGVKHTPYADNWMYMHINGGRDAGSALEHSMKFVQDNGLCPRVFDVNGNPYRMGDLVYSLRSLPEQVIAEAKKQAAKHRAFEAFRVPKRDFKLFCRTVATALARRQPIVFAMHVGQAFTRLQNGYVQPSRGPGNHAMLLQSAKWVGGSNLIAADIRNSWGPSMDSIYGPRSGGWGDQGFGLCTMEQAFACLNNHDYYVLTSVRQDPTASLLDELSLQFDKQAGLPDFLYGKNQGGKPSRPASEVVN